MGCPHLPAESKEPAASTGPEQHAESGFYRRINGVTREQNELGRAGNCTLPIFATLLIPKDRDMNPDLKAELYPWGTEFHSDYSKLAVRIALAQEDQE
jgi:hypothetical protein